MLEVRPILMIEDDHAIAENVIYLLEADGFTVIHKDEGNAGLAAFNSTNPQLVLLDVGLPGLSGYELLKAIRKSDPSIPVIMVTAENEEINKIMGFEMGADDYVTKPFSVLELIARVKAVLRRSIQSRETDAEPVQAGPFSLNEEHFIAKYFGEEIQLTSAEFRLLAQLVRYPARVFQRDALIDAIYSGDHAVTERSVDASIKRIRKKLRAVRSDIDPIESIYGEGYKLSRFQDKEESS